MDQPLQDQQGNTKHPLPGAEDDGAEGGCRRSETPAMTPQPVICRIALPSASAAPVSRDQTPVQASARRAVGELQLGPEAIRDARSQV